MAVNDKQKIAIVPIDANLKPLIDSKLAAGFVIQFMVSLTPVQSEVLIIYSEPDEI